VPPANWIDRPERLADAVARWMGVAEIAIDTEFVFERTYRPRLGIIQIAAGDEIALVDAVRLKDLTPLAPVIGGGPRKLVHSGSGDLPILRRATGVTPQPLLDTQIAAAFAGLGASLSYAALVKLILGVELGKHETRTDWLRRPLTPEQLRYAAEDVEHLPPVAAELERRLADVGRLEWALEDSATLAAIDDATDPNVAFRRVKGLDRQPAAVRAVGRVLAAWREREAERLDLARPFLLRDETLIALARKETLAPADAATLPGYDVRRHGGYGPRWAAALADAHAVVAAGEAPPEDVRRSVEEEARREALDKAIAAVVTPVATALGLAPELLLSRRQRERAIDAWDGSGSLADAVGGFRGTLLGAGLATVKSPA
jgi:ribonuclease D